jgi:Trypsin-like peptidase domain
MPTTLDRLTLTTIPLQQYFKNTSLGQGTGFIWRTSGKDYLVTNWHVMSMRDFFMPEKNLRTDAGRPNELRGLFNIQTGDFAREKVTIRIRDEDDKPLWLVHPTRPVDIAVLPVDISANPVPLNSQAPIKLPLYPMNELANARLRVAVGMEVFILGYPFPIELPGYPVWKRGSIASEPELASLAPALGSSGRREVEFGSHPRDYVLVDTASRPGMSGAPVIRRSWSNHDLEPNFVAAVETPIDRFIGVYSGRARTTSAYEAQIGLVWNASLIEEIIVGNRRDAD